MAMVNPQGNCLANQLVSCRRQYLRKIEEQVAFQLCAPGGKQAKQRDQEQEQREKGEQKVIGNSRGETNNVIVVNFLSDLFRQFLCGEPAQMPNGAALLLGAEDGFSHSLELCASGIRFPGVGVASGGSSFTCCAVLQS
jgi:hypothetical protein